MTKKRARYNPKTAAKREERFEKTFGRRDTWHHVCAGGVTVGLRGPRCPLCGKVRDG